MACGLAQEQRHGIGCPLCHLVVGVPRVLHALPAAVIANLEAPLLNRFLERLAVVVGEAESLRHLTQLGEIDATRRLLWARWASSSTASCRESLKSVAM